MHDERLAALLRQVASGEVAPDAAARELALPFEALSAGDSPPFARVDHARERRRGFPEVVLAAGKSGEQVLAITRALSRRTARTLVTRVDEEVATRICRAIPDAVHHRMARLVLVSREAPAPLHASIGVVSAGTSDIPVAEEAALTAEAMGASVERIFDVGVAGIHRLLREAPRLAGFHTLVVVAGMEAALAPVVAGLVPCPVVAVPTSVGYGASFGGLAALLALLNSCAPGVTVVNVDNGFGAGYAAALAIAHLRRLEGPEGPRDGSATR